MVLVNCPCVFRPRRLTQNAGPGIRVRHFSCKFLYKMVLVKCPCAFLTAQVRTKCWPRIRVRHFPAKFRCKMAMVRAWNGTSCPTCVLAGQFFRAFWLKTRKRIRKSQRILRMTVSKIHCLFRYILIFGETQTSVSELHLPKKIRCWGACV